MRNNKVPIFIFTGLLLFTLGCSFSGLSINRVEVGDLQFDSEVVELGDAEEVRVDVKMGAGELKVDNGSDSLMEADFTYNVESWTPEVSYSVEDKKGRLTIRQPQTSQITLDGQFKYEWDLRFARDIPLDMRIECGAGDYDLDLARLMLTSLDVKVGAGNVNVDLTENPDLEDVEVDIGAGSVDMDFDGLWEKDVNVDIQGGVGSISLRLPKDVGVRVHVSKGIGNVNTSGLGRDGDTYTNAAYGESDVVLDIYIQAGIGQIDLTVSP